MKQKSEALQKFNEFEAAATNKAGCKIGTLRTDNGGEYMSSDFEEYLRKRGIKHETYVAHCPQQNGIAELYWIQQRLWCIMLNSTRLSGQKLLTLQRTSETML